MIAYIAVSFIIASNTAVTIAFGAAWNSWAVLDQVILWCAMTAGFLLYARK